MRRTLAWRPLALTLALAAAWPAHAGLFEDEEARKAILDLRGKHEQLLNQQRQSAEQVQQLQRGLLDLNNQNEQLRAEVARLRGQLEQFQRDVSDVQRRQKDIAQGVDERMKRLEPQKVSLDGKDFMADPEEKRAYEEAIGVLRSGEFDRAQGSLQAFLKRYPASGYADAARYWLGNAQYGRRDYKEAANTFRQFAAAAPDHPRVPEAQLALANCQIELRDNKSAKKTLEDLIKAFPKSEAALAARERLVGLK